MLGRVLASASLSWIRVCALDLSLRNFHWGAEENSMATIVNYVAKGTHVGSKESVWVQIVFFFNVGSGQVTDFDSFTLGFQGRIDTVFFKGDLNIHAELTDHNPGAMEGPCAVSVNGCSDNNAHYRVDGNHLVLECNFNGVRQNITVSQIYNGDQTELVLSGQYDYTIHLAPV
jgi:hypothetical protein